MEMKIDNDTFYLLETGDVKSIHDTEGNAIQALKTIAAENKNIDLEGMSIVEVNTAGEKWEISQVPWSKIAIGLIREG